jgi:WhiB family transcriptional regulator, redox-sensing transcriptional regulator
METHEDLGVFVEVGMDMEWRRRASCRGLETNVFFPGRGESLSALKSYCKFCPVVKPCLEYSFRSMEKFGIWGGTSERERRKVRSFMRRNRESGKSLLLSEMLHTLGINYTHMKDDLLEPFTGDGMYS